MALACFELTASAARATEMPSHFDKLTLNPTEFFFTEFKKANPDNAPDANADQGSRSETPEINRMAFAIDGLAAKLGRSTKITRMIQDYREILGLSSYKKNNFGEGNNGLRGYATRLLKENLELQRMAGVFYNELVDLDNAHTSFFEVARSADPDATIEDLFVRYPRQGQLSLSHEAGLGEFKYLAPGWAFQKALRATNGNPNDALRVIGLCGHDDVNQGDLQARNNLSGAVRDFKTAKEELRSKKIQLIQSIALAKASIKTESFKVKRAEELREQLAKDEKDLAEILEKERSLNIFNFANAVLPCPADISHFYVPKSLDASADIPSALKTEIIKAQAPEDLEPHLKGLRTPGASLEPKYYHVYGAAFVACEMIRKGHDKRTVVNFQKALAWAYRTVRMTEDIVQLHQMRDSVKVHYEAYRKAYLRALSRYLLTGKWQPDSDVEIGEPDGVLFLGSTPRPPRMKTPEEIYFEDTEGELDGMELLNRWALGGGRIEFKNLVIQIPQTNFITNFVRVKPKGWTEERFAKAKKRLEVFLVDWKWTIAQHEAGAEFAARVCSPEK